MKAERVLWAALVVLVGQGCAGLESRVRRAAVTDCPILIEQYPDTVSSSSYQDLGRSVRQPYEARVASCWLEAGKPDRAIEIAQRWEDGDPARHAVAARAAALRGDEKRVESEFASLAAAGGAEIDYYSLDEFKPFIAKQWFIGAAWSGYDPERDHDLERFTSRLLARSGQRLLPLRVAAADRQRQPGEWVLWLGIVRSGTLDRENRRTVLLAEGAELRRTLTAIDRRVKETRFVAWRAGAFVEGKSTPVYSPTERTYAEDIVPSGPSFVVEFSGLNEELAAVGALYVLGRLKGRDSATGHALVEAIAVQSRSARTTTETSP